MLNKIFLTLLAKIVRIYTNFGVSASCLVGYSYGRWSHVEVPTVSGNLHSEIKFRTDIAVTMRAEA